MLSRYNEIIHKVTEIHLRINFTDPPFNLKEFCQYYPAFKMESSHDLPQGVDGRLIVQDDFRYIYYRADMPHTRNRFTAGHEIGHAFIHFEEQFLCNIVEHRSREYFLRRPIKEQEADFFAAELLVPMPMLDGMIIDDLSTMSLKDYNDLLSILADKFLVSKACMRLRLEDLNDLRRTTAGRGLYLRRR